MTCPHCEYENRDDNARCFRCGQTFDLSEVEVEPRRTSGARGHRLVARERRPQWRDAYLDATACAIYSVVPGLGQALHGERVRGAFLAVVWLGCLAVAAATDPPMLSTREMWLDWLQNPRWLPLTTHAWIIADAFQMRLRQRGLPAGWRQLAVISMLAVVFLSAPNMALQAAQARDRVMGVEMRQLMADPGDPTVARGDVVAFHNLQASDPDIHRGDVVAGTPFHYEHYVQRVGTVRAVAGDVVAWHRADGRLAVNGRDQALAPHVQTALAHLDDFVRTMQKGELLVFPMSQERGLESVEDALIPEDHVQAVALRIVDPPARRRILRTR